MNSERMYKVLIAPHVSEKSALIGEIANQYAFKVAKDATKSEIKIAVEQLFNVSVVELQVLNVKGKVKAKRAWSNAPSSKLEEGLCQAGSGA